MVFSEFTCANYGAVRRLCFGTVSRRVGTLRATEKWMGKKGKKCLNRAVGDQDFEPMAANG